MTQVWQGDAVIAVTRVQAGPCLAIQVKTSAKDGYEAVQVGYGEKKEKNIKKPQLGNLKKLGTNGNKDKIYSRYLKEFRWDKSKDGEKAELKPGDIIDASIFAAGDTVRVTGISKGRGFQGVVKRHGFHGQDKTHGNKDQLRMPGSIGATGPAHVFKGQKMPGRMGGDKTTVANLEIIEVDQENNILLIKGAVPGARSGLLLIQGEGRMEARSQKSEVKKDKEEKVKKEENEKAEEAAMSEDKKTEEKKVDKKEVRKKNENIEEVVVEANKKLNEEHVD